MMHRCRVHKPFRSPLAALFAVVCALGFAQSAVAAPATVDFTDETPDSYVRGSGESIPFTVDGDLPPNSDVLVIAWSHDEQRMVDEFAHVLTEEPWVIESRYLEELPDGRVQLQLVRRLPNEKRDERSIAHHEITVRSALPGVSFPGDTPAQYVKGSGETIPFRVGGELPEGGDVLVLAWSDAQERMVDEFAHTLRREPWQIGAARMDQLPTGSVVLQVFSRYDGERKSADRRIEILPALPTLSFADAPSSYQIGSGESVSYAVDGTVPSGSTLQASAYQDGSEVSGFAHELATSSGTIDPAQLDALPSGSVELRLTLSVPEREDVTASHTLAVESAPSDSPDDGSDDDSDSVTVPEVSFADGAPSTYERGSGASISFTVDGELPEGGDVLVIAWSDDEARMVDEFAHTQTDEPWQISPAQLNELPTGSVNLQVYTRYEDQRKSADHWVDVLPALPTLSFADAPSSYQIGSGESVSYAVDGTVPSGSTLQASAYQDGSEVSGFAHELATSSGTIDPAQLDALPSGSVELRLTLSVPEREDVTASHTLAVESAPSDSPDDGSDDDSDSVTVPEVSFADGAPSTYERGSGASISFTVDGELPEGGDILAIAWSDGEQRMVDEFAHSYTSSPWTIPGDQLDLLPTGGISLQLLVRVPDQDHVRVAHWLTVEASSTDDDDDSTDDGSTDDGSTDDDTTDDNDGTTDDGSSDDGTNDGSTDDGSSDDGTTDDGSSGDIDAGWTDLSQYDVDRKVYVSSSEGNDKNDGLSSSSPVRTLKRGYELLRSGRADWLLLKSGDVWDQNSSGSGRWFATNNWRKGGRSQSAPMVITTYGGYSRAVLKNLSLRQDWETESSYVFVVNLEFYASARDPKSQDYGTVSNSNIHVNGFEWRYGEHILLEGCKFHFYERDNVMFLNGASPSSRFVRNITIRRNIIANSWSHSQHSQGLKTDEVEHILIEENLLDHNGWNKEAGAEKEGFNHNMYLTNTRHLVLRNNISSRSSYDGIKLAADEQHGVSDVEMVNNLFIGNRLGFNLSGTARTAERGHHDVTIKRNVVATGSGAEGFVQGSDGLDFHENLLLNKTEDNNQPVLKFSDYKHYDIAIVKNIVHNRPTSWSDPFDAPEGAMVKDNLVELDSNRYEDPTRTYYDGAGSPSEFFEQVYQQSKQRWRTEYTAAEVNSWIRGGFSLKPIYD
ncbi:MAG: right-handed parallel beta-helix repeat-containing protein [Phycisphaeraceae bacterium]